ncbi:MAG: hypothetical protein IPP79_10985 [Chitinophagaceae bacterium]|nr:hypothetical protein [Chitinophagaceae bacterium]
MDSLQDLLAVQQPDKAQAEQMIALINELIVNDFDKLVQLLYRLDIDELKLKTILRNNPDTDAGKIITALIIERQLQKKKSREEFRTKRGGD